MKKGFYLFQDCWRVRQSLPQSVEPIEPLGIDSLINLQGVVISANKIQVNRNSVPLTISVIDRDQIEASSESALLPVLSERVPGLFVTEKGDYRIWCFKRVGRYGKYSWSRSRE